jgi:hypothetical protein
VVRVPLSPNVTDALKFRRHVQLRRFLEYKSFWRRLPNDPSNDSWVGSFAAWINEKDCEGEHDPRCLPFHVFRGDGRGLRTPTGRETFNLKYGLGARRTDDSGWDWALNPRDYHGQESLCIAGFNLRRGCHWDVTGYGWTIRTPVGLWLANGHVNIYPDAHIRANGSSVRKLS